MTVPPRGRQRENGEESEPRERSPLEESIDPPRNFTISLEDRVRAMAAGAPAYARRKRRIEDALARYERTLRDVAEACMLAGADDETLVRTVTTRAHRLDIAKTNELSASHNRYFPSEANLPLDPRTGAYLHMGEPFRPEPLIDVGSLVAGVISALRGST